VHIDIVHLVETGQPVEVFDSLDEQGRYTKKVEFSRYVGGMSSLTTPRNDPSREE
jgi:hypothetical protein